ncbi:sortase domain-containing protein [Arenimonas daejeonensis]|uniref:sortase domain-containing protein n=1 Tax=Arenimonas daejeonensis TaxID=370777 RepID=UPI001D13B780|nr:sortase [Arenimonas daejeonensis]
MRAGYPRKPCSPRSCWLRPGESSKHDGSPHRPWPWADTHPVARIEQARLGISQVVLAGDSGRPLAFGPGWAESSARPGSGAGTIIISGHRDTHFAWLRDLRSGEAVTLETLQGPRDYVVVHREVVDSRTHRIATHDEGGKLLLVTCWPFDATAARGPLRHVTTLLPVDAGFNPAARATR